MLPRRATCSASLFHPTSSQYSQHRSVATKLAPKWTPQHPAPSASSSTPSVPAPNHAKWAVPASSNPSPPTHTTPEFNPSFNPSSSTRRQASSFPNVPPSRTSRMTPSSSQPMGKWARPPTIPIPTSTDTANNKWRPDYGLARKREHRAVPARQEGMRDVSRRKERYERPPLIDSGRPWPQQLPRTLDPPVRIDDNVQHSLQREIPKGNQGPIVEEALDESIAGRVDILENEEVLDRPRNGGRGLKKLKFKHRGSLQEGGEIERHSRVSDVRAPKQKKLKQHKMVRLTQDVYIPNVVSVSQLARLLGVRLESLKRKMVQAGMSDATSYDHVLNSEYASMLALEFNKNPIINDEAAFDIFPPPAHPDPSTLPLRPPVVTIMGHVDHGKTTLLDTLRSASVAQGEAGGITQHIGAFSVPVPHSSGASIQSITFLDTPGHAAFSAMRARGASVTDIVVLVVAADDGVMPQTKEVIELIKKDEGKVNVVVAINKIDKPGVDSEAIQNALLAEGLQLETFGGEIPSVEVSGLTGQGLDRLVETISAVAEMSDLRAEQTGNVFGYVLESKVLKGLGPVATVLILRGDLTPTTNLICGTAHARVRQLTDSAGKVVKIAYPGMAVTVSGWKELPSAGEEVLQGTEADIKKAISNRRRRLQLATVVQDAEAINIQRRHDREKKEEDKATTKSPDGKPDASRASVITPTGPKELRLVVKGDVSGSVEAVVGALQGIGNKAVTVKIVQSLVGDITESDVMMAKTAEGLIVAFSVSTPRSVQALAAQNDVPIVTSSIIYRLMDDIKEKVIALLPRIIEKRVTGEAAVLQLFEIQIKRHQSLKVAGCRVTNGLLEKSKRFRVVRASEIVHEGTLHTLRHLKKDVQEIRKDMECGLSLDGFEDLREGDMIQAFQIIEKPGLL